MPQSLLQFEICMLFLHFYAAQLDLLVTFYGYKWSQSLKYLTLSHRFEPFTWIFRRLFTARQSARISNTSIFSYRLFILDVNLFLNLEIIHFFRLPNAPFFNVDAKYIFNINFDIRHFFFDGSRSAWYSRDCILMLLLMRLWKLLTVVNNFSLMWRNLKLFNSVTSKLMRYPCYKIVRVKYF